MGIKEPWEESDEKGSVTFATVKTVRLLIERYRCSCVEFCSMGTRHIPLSREVSTKGCSYLDIRLLFLLVPSCPHCKLSSAGSSK